VHHPWARFGEARGWPPVSPDPFPVQGHTDTPPYAVVRVSPEGSSAYASLVVDTVVPTGTVVVMGHQSRDGKVPGPFYVMEKGDAGWGYLALSSDGTPLAIDQGRCAGCHANAVSDALFGPPRPKTPARE